MNHTKKHIRHAAFRRQWLKIHLRQSLTGYFGNAGRWEDYPISYVPAPELKPWGMLNHQPVPAIKQLRIYDVPFRINTVALLPQNDYVVAIADVTQLAEDPDETMFFGTNGTRFMVLLLWLPKENRWVALNWLSSTFLHKELRGVKIHPVYA